MTPNARSLDECRRRGWICQTVEQRIPRTFITRDLFGCIDIVAVGSATGIIGIQATATAAHHAHRKDKILAEPRIRMWIESGGVMLLWSWSKRGPRGKRKVWTLREEEITAADFAAGEGAA